MNAKADDQDPSMDDILASIRRIMLDEQARLKEKGPLTAEASEEAQDDVPPPVLVLDDSMAVREPPPATEPATDPAGSPLIVTTLEPIIVEPTIGAPFDDAPALAEPIMLEPAHEAPAEPVAPHAESDPEPEPEPEPVVEPAEPVAETAPTGPFSQLDAQALEALLAPAAAAAATASVDALLRQIQAERESFLQGGANEGPSLEQVVRGEIRPMLKAWLDEHLPAMVERLVRAELARLTLRHGS